jgi:hypothetical protein
MSRILLLVLLILIVPAILFAQTDSGSISGMVKDEQGRILPGTAVSARDTETGVERTMLTGSTGAYYLSPLRPSIYDVTFRLDGFMTRIEQKIVVNAGTRITLNAEMIEGTAEVKVSRPAEQIEVVGTPGVETSKSHVTSLVTEQQVEELPVNGRNFLALAFLTPGVTPTGYRGSSSENVQIATPGSMGRGASVVVDGMDDNNEIFGGMLQMLSQDAVGEFQVLTHGFSAETGRSSSSVVNVITKSGTNELHGGAFIYYRDRTLTAKHPLVDESYKEPPFDREQTGLSVGGPLVKDQAFWFASYEYTNEDSASASALRDPSIQDFPNILVPTPLHQSLATFRFNYEINNSDSLFAGYSYQGNTIVSTDGDPSTLTTAANDFHSVVSGWTHIFSTNKINEFRLADIYWYNSAEPQTPRMRLVFPSLTTGPGNFVPTWKNMNRLQLKNDFTWTAGNHLIKFGGELQMVRSDFYLIGNQDGIVVLADDWAQDDLNNDGIINDNDIPVGFAYRTSPSSTGFVPDLDNDYWAGYIQDDWHVGKGLTFNLGLRYELDTQSNGANDKNERDRIHFYPNDYGMRHNDWNNFGPRLGFAWDLYNNGKAIVRGGYGIYYDRVILNALLLERLWNGVNLHYDKYGPLDSYGNRVLLEDPFAGEFVVLSGRGIYILSNDLQSPRVQQFGAGVEREISPNLRVSADYVGSRGDHFASGPEVNHPRKAVTVNPNISESVIEATSAAKMSYDGLLISATSRMWKNLQFQLAYTLARMSTVADDEFVTLGDLDAADPLISYGASGQQNTHRIVVNGIYELPRGFQVSGIFTYASGLPFNIITNRDFLLDGAGFDRFPLLPRNAGGRQVRTGAELNQWITIFNTSNDPAIVAMRQNCGMCTLRPVDPNLKFTDHFINLDLRFSKTFAIGRFEVEPIVEFFNIFNVANFSGYEGDIGSSEFGKPFATAGEAFGQGGPRAIQFAVRFQF